MRWRVVLVATLLPSAPALADDQRDLFGLGDDPRPAAKAPTCEDGRAVGCVTATNPFADVSPGSLRTWLTGEYLLLLPVGDARHDAVAHFATGASRDEAGVTFGGATGVENRWTIEGAPADGIRAGAAETSIPLTFLEGIAVTAGGFSARDRVGTGGTVDARLVRGTEHHRVVARAWGALSTDAPRRPIAVGSYQVRRTTTDAPPSASLAVVATGPLPRVAGGSAWYAAGIAPQLEPTEVTWRAGRLVDVDADGTPDREGNGQLVLDPIDPTSISANNVTVPILARAGWERGAHAVDLTLIGQLSQSSVFVTNASPYETAIRRNVLAGDGIATWRGTWTKTRARAQLAWHRSARTDEPRASSADTTQLQSAYVPPDLAGDGALSAACRDDGVAGNGDPSPEITNCPVPIGFFASGAAGLLVDQTGDRPTATVDVAHQIGAHVLRVGATVEDSRLVTTSRYTGGALVRSLFGGHTDTQRFLGGDCEETPGAPCTTASEQSLRYRTRYMAGYVEETFTLSPGITADAGLRWERMQVGSVLDFSDQLAPRLALAWDPIGGGRSRIWATLGRAYVMLPAGVGATLIGRSKTVRDIASPLGTDRVIDGGSAFAIADGIEPAAQDEATFGVEVGQPGLVRATAWLQGRTLRRGYETVSLDPEQFTVHFDNPGRAGSPAARRDVVVVATEVAVTPTAQTAFRAAYSYTHATGSWAGPFDPRQGANLFAGADFDLDQTNLFGPLPTDARHRVVVEAARAGHLGGFEVGAATRLTLQSGRPRNVLADTDAGLIYLLPRGSAGRGPMISQANVRLWARWHRTDLTLDVFNVFDRAAATTVGELYTGSTARPIVGGTAEDLVFAKLEGGAPVPRRTSFQLPTAYQSPFAITLGLHRAF